MLRKDILQRDRAVALDIRGNNKEIVVFDRISEGVVGIEDLDRRRIIYYYGTKRIKNRAVLDGGICR